MIILRLIRLFIKLTTIFTILIAITIVGFYIYAYFTPKTIIKKANSYFVYDNKGKAVYQGSSTKKWVTLDEVSKYYIDAVISIEDKNFYKHNGFDYPRIIKAFFKNVSKKKIVEGASTISQQYIKNIYENFDKTIKRKWKETLLTLNLEVHYSKDEILEGYINTINFGKGNIGIYNASMYYFNKDPIDLSLEESIILAGIPKSPNNYNPVSSYNESINRAKVVLKAMVNNNKVSKTKARTLFNNRIKIYGKNNKENLNMLMYYQDAVLDELKNKVNLPDEIIKRKGIKIYTCLDMESQKLMEENIYKYMNDEEMQVASMIINPADGCITALTGGLDYSKSEFNRATKAKRQVGSTMKSFLYYAALENNLTSSSVFTSEESSFKIDNNKVYSPQNYGNKYANKKITMNLAIALSDNIYAVKTNMFLGGDKLIHAVNSSGVKENLKDIPSLPLGTIELKMIDYAQGYQTLANEGNKIPIHIIKKVEDSDGNILYKYNEKEEQVLNPDYVYILNEMLSNTSNEKFKDYTSPTALIISNKLDDKYAIKTGTTNTDFWTIGYNKDRLMLVWAGNDDSSDVSPNKSSYTKNIFADTISNIRYSKNTWYKPSENIVSRELIPSTGEESDDFDKTATFYFIKGSDVISVSTE